MKQVSCFSKRIIALLICAGIFCTFSITALAADGWQNNLPLPKWTYITLVSGGVLKETGSSGRHTVGGEVLLLDPDNYVTINATVQSYNGGWYNTSHKWTSSGYGGAGVVEAIYLAPGTYRMRLIIKVYSPSNVLLEETTLYTGDTII